VQHPGYRDRSARQSRELVFVTDSTVLTETDAAEAVGPREGDVVTGLRVGLGISVAIWLGMIFLGMLIFG